MVEYVVRQAATAKLLVTPVIERDIDVGDGSTQRRRIFGRHAGHVLRSGPRQLVDLPNVGKGLSSTVATTSATSRTATGDVRPEAPTNESTAPEGVHAMLRSSVVPRILNTSARY
jgi:hypothetical protein